MTVSAVQRKDGIGVSDQGALSLYGVASGSVVPSTAIPIKGAATPFGKYVAPDGALYVRFV